MTHTFFNPQTTTAAKIPVNGVLLLDKPQGMTSQQAVSRVKWLLKSPMHDSRKAGHTGTLDPMATGLLPICLGEATKFSHYQLNAVKSYQATIQLGAKTDTGDADGQITERAALPDLSQIDLVALAASFCGEQLQTPPMYAALKQDGKKLYELARQGIEVEREPRAITINFLDLHAPTADTLTLNVTCSKGTYVRVLGEDIAHALGTVGHLTALRRTATGDFRLNHAITLADFEALSSSERLAKLLPVDACVATLPVLMLTDEQTARIRHGQRLNLSDQRYQLARIFSQARATDTPQVVRLYYGGCFLGLGELAAHGRLQPTKLVQLTP